MKSIEKYWKVLKLNTFQYFSILFSNYDYDFGIEKYRKVLKSNEK